MPTGLFPIYWLQLKQELRVGKKGVVTETFNLFDFIENYNKYAASLIHYSNINAGKVWLRLERL